MRGVLSFRAMRAKRWVVLCAALAGLAPLAAARDVSASVSVAITFDALVHDAILIHAGADPGFAQQIESPRTVDGVLFA